MLAVYKTAGSTDAPCNFYTTMLAKCAVGAHWDASCFFPCFYFIEWGGVTMPGFRVYFGQFGHEVHIISGGRKKTQQADIKSAIDFWGEYEKES